MTRFKDYDAALAELEPESFEFRIGERDFVAPQDADAKQMLDFLRKSASTNSATVADGMHALLGDEIWSFIYQRPSLVVDNGETEVVERPKIPWPALRALINDLATYYGGGLVGDPKAGEAALHLINPPTTEEPSMDGSETTSGSSMDGTISNEEEQETTDTDSETS